MDDDMTLAPLLAECTGAPYPGHWQDAPFAERTVDGVRYALVALDPGLSALGVRHADGSLWELPEDGTPHLVNSDIAAFLAFTRAYTEAAEEADAHPGSDQGSEDAAEEAADALTEALVARFEGLDAAAVTDENSFWCVAAEELGYGMNA